MNKKIKNILVFSSLCIIIIGTLFCKTKQKKPDTLRLATTTSVDNSGLLTEILPVFESKYNIKISVIAVGTGQALALGENGDVDIVLVHAPPLEKLFVENGFGTQRIAIMYNDFILVGPSNDPAHIGTSLTAMEALQLIASTQASFVSRGDSSGTHFLEQTLWNAVNISPDPESEWYSSIGQGMGATLNFANETLTYTLTDRGTYLAQRAQITNLTVLFGGDNVINNPDQSLYNYYSIIPINPETHPQTQYELAIQLADWFTSVSTQELIKDFGIEIFNQPLFYPNSKAWHATQK